MGDHGHHDPGGHELEAINTKMLFRLLFSLSLVTLLAAVAVVQWFNSQRRELQARNAAAGSFQLKLYEQEMVANLEGLDAVADGLLVDPSKLTAPPPHDGWTHPDDLVGMGAAAKPAEQHEEVEPVPVERPEPAEDAPAEDAPAEDAPADDAPAGDAPEPPADPKPAPADPKPAPADGGNE